MSKLININLPIKLSPAHLVFVLLVNKGLIFQMIKRNVLGRYKGSVLGLGWAFLNPLFMLVIYTFVFSTIFKSKWIGDVDPGIFQFALNLFCGMIVFSLFSESLNLSVGVITGNVNYVQKVIFPLEILPVVIVGSALFHAFISILALLIVYFFSKGYINLSSFYVPIVLLPLCIVSLGLSWVLASLGVYLRDIGQTIGILTSGLMFLSPVFYPLSSLPENYRVWILLNPLSFIIEQMRLVVMVGDNPDWVGIGKYTFLASIFSWLCYVWFQKTRRGFADVL
jgi:lipopolysaccharide transport system permease protein